MSVNLLPVKIASKHFICSIDTASPINFVSFEQFQIIQNSLHRKLEIQPIDQTFVHADSTIFAFHGYFIATLKSASKSINTAIYVCYKPIPRPIISLSSFLALK